MISFSFNSIFDQPVMICQKDKDHLAFIENCLFKAYYCKGVTVITSFPAETGRELKEE